MGSEAEPWVVLPLVAVLLVWGGCTSAKTANVTVYINGERPIAITDEDFICVTLDWYPPDKCNFGTCSWGQASLLNLDLKNPVLFNAIKALSPLKIRLGGMLQDKVYYQTEQDQHKSLPCIPFAKNSSDLFGFTQGCLPLSRWDELNSFFDKSGALVIFGLNELQGKAILPNLTAVGPWNSTNAASLIGYTFKKGYHIYGWELGNELSGNGVGASIDANSYAADTIVLHDMILDVYKGIEPKPKILAPGGFFDPAWFTQFIAEANGSLDVITHHIYTLGPGSEEDLVDKILNASVLDDGARAFKDLQNVIKTSRNKVDPWVGEAAGVFMSGRNGVTNVFLFSFWYLDQLGLASIYNTKTYCRQTLIGGNYGLLNTTSFHPNPDYYSALLWHSLMGRNVLLTNFTGTRKIRAYAHCAKQTEGVTLLLINIDGNATVQTEVNFNGTSMPLQQQRGVSTGVREEYHLTPLDSNIQSQTVLLNGEALTVNASGRIPALQPVLVNATEPITIAPYSIVFVHIPFASLPACKSDASISIMT